MFASLQRAGKQHFNLLIVRFGAACQKQGLAEDHDVFLPPQIEMTHQNLTIDLRQQANDFVDALIGHLDVEGAGKMQRLELLHP